MSQRLPGVHSTLSCSGKVRVSSVFDHWHVAGWSHSPTTNSCCDRGSSSYTCWVCSVETGCMTTLQPSWHALCRTLSGRPPWPVTMGSSLSPHSSPLHNQAAPAWCWTWASLWCQNYSWDTPKPTRPCLCALRYPPTTISRPPSRSQGPITGHTKSLWGPKTPTQVTALPPDYL